MITNYQSAIQKTKVLETTLSVTLKLIKFCLPAVTKNLEKSQTLYDTKRIFTLKTVRIIVAFAKYATRNIILSAVASHSCAFKERTKKSNIVREQVVTC